MEHCIEATEAINSLRALVGYHPGQRVEARIRFPAWTARGGVPRGI